MMKKLILPLLIGISFNVHADTESNLTNYFNGLGFNTKVNSPTSYKGQSAYYFSGGEVSLKSHISNIQPMQVTLPSISAGCGGIDILGGGLSFIDSDKLKQFANDVAHNIAGLSADLAVQTLTPQFHGVMTKFQDWAQKINGFNMNSCATARAGVDAIKSWASSAENNKAQCEQAIVDSNSGSWADAKSKCNSNPESVLLGAKNDEDKKNIILINKNIAWDELQKISFLAADQEYAELFMSITGTIIYDAKGSKKVYASKLSEDGAIFNALLDGGEYSVYKCDKKDTCLSPSIVTKNMSSAKALKSQIADKINALVVALQNDIPLTDADKSFLEITSLPVMRLMSSLLEEHENTDLYVSSYSEVIAVDIVQKYLASVTTVTNDILAQSITSPDDVTQLQQNVRRAQAYISGVPMNAMQKLTQLNQLVKQRKEVERTIQADMNNYLLKASL
ncbi:conjugal transfer protein TraH [Vibrio furnissii]|uniref:conjugal transfer protein TraH n=1 Tax=Vibrio furnissii TaxID=29494 RepID=UPI001C9C5AF1|nr:conjugal transfer protein TraH [Vibrio furnissii]MBY7933071.1 conjugal transfer protein TraH [Vibrio fluvialis]MCG6230271.1 conjugal transfer protein TraH [Vibrio furnissii]MCG6268470.1 conjugal transfer protein TraH [Vibrio furnissii]